jgi:hypothetical protein
MGDPFEKGDIVEEGMDGRRERKYITAASAAYLHHGVLRTGSSWDDKSILGFLVGSVVGTARKSTEGAADCLQRPVRRSSACSLPIADGQDSEDILGSTAYLSPKG